MSTTFIANHGRILQASLLVTLIVVGGHPGGPAPAALPIVPSPLVIGPVPATVPPGDPSHDYPFFSTDADLAGRGYVEEEFFFEGFASRYDMSQPLQTASVIDSGHPYRTRLIVRRPVSPGRFNGTVLMEWQNNALSFDLDAAWVASHEHMMRRGYAWIGVSAFRAGIHAAALGLKAWSPSRYSTLDVTEGGAILDDALSFDIFSQAAVAVKSPGGTDPMGGLAVERVFAVGASQSSTALVRYHNSIHPLAGVFDGFFSVVGVVGAIRTDLDTKVFRVWSETEAVNAPLASRQPDSDYLRRWEVAGAAHYDRHMRDAVNPLRQRDFGPVTPASCNLPPFSRIPFYHVLNAALDHLVNWVATGTPPPTGPEIELVTLGPPSVVARDAYGNALGGIRLSQHAVPTAVNTGVNGPSTNFCRTYGSFVPFDDATLMGLYANHGIYVSQVAAVTSDNVRAGYITVEDAAATIRDAALSGIGRQ